jgi:YD repeat-containing protein
VNKKSDGSIISSYHYIYDANNNITQEVETTDSETTTKTYTYDKLNRLTRADYSDGTYEAYTYDAMGNRLTKATATETISYEYDFDNRLLSAGSTYFLYDKSGNLIKKVSSDKTEEYQYDYNNLLTYYTNGTDVVQYKYDGNGNRVSKIVNGTTTNYVNDVNRPIVQVIMEADGNWSATKKYVYGLDLISQEEM